MLFLSYKLQPYWIISLLLYKTQMVQALFVIQNMHTHTHTSNSHILHTFALYLNLDLSPQHFFSLDAPWSKPTWGDLTWCNWTCNLVHCKREFFSLHHLHIHLQTHTHIDTGKLCPLLSAHVKQDQWTQGVEGILSTTALLGWDLEGQFSHHKPDTLTTRLGCSQKASLWKGIFYYLCVNLA